VRELENVVRHVVAVSKGPEVCEADLPQELSLDRRERGLAPIVVPGMTLEEIERVAIITTYESLKRNARAAADALGISVRTMHYRLKRYADEGWMSDPPQRSPSGAGYPPRSESGSHQVRPRLLLADDDSDVRWSLAELLGEEGFEVIAVSSGSAVLEALGSALLFEQRAHPDVIVTDIRMPGTSGIEVLEGVRANGWRIPVVLITAFGDEQIRSYAKSLDAELIEKPIQLDLLRSAVRRATADIGAR
jgi:DNA-binding NtrC family response regulator